MRARGFAVCFPRRRRLRRHAAFAVSHSSLARQTPSRSRCHDRISPLSDGCVTCVFILGPLSEKEEVMEKPSESMNATKLRPLHKHIVQMEPLFSLLHKPDGKEFRSQFEEEDV